ncbi:myb transcription factor [Anaeramoeba flamelloides]|uniref:Myb transcription factor n=1 Tax=Anaeramoeba flamelloides TaxID=1746091 RepID=A0AAV8ABE7_9EUKA|nr:myb transcription factor [Anaeramoeba flamelloides]
MITEKQTLQTCSLKSNYHTANVQQKYPIILESVEVKDTPNSFFPSKLDQLAQKKLDFLSVLDPKPNLSSTFSNRNTSINPNIGTNKNTNTDTNTNITTYPDIEKITNTNLLVGSKINPKSNKTQTPNRYSLRSRKPATNPNYPLYSVFGFSTPMLKTQTRSDGKARQVQKKVFNENSMIKRAKQKSLKNFITKGLEESKQGNVNIDNHGEEKPKGYNTWYREKKLAWDSYKTNPNRYYYRFNERGEPNKSGRWTSKENLVFIKRCEEYGVNREWGLFSRSIPGRVGYVCANHFRSLLRNDPQFREKFGKDYRYENGKLIYKLRTIKNPSNEILQEKEKEKEKEKVKEKGELSVKEIEKLKELKRKMQRKRKKKNKKTRKRDQKISEEKYSFRTRHRFKEREKERVELETDPIPMTKRAAKGINSKSAIQVRENKNTKIEETAGKQLEISKQTQQEITENSNIFSKNGRIYLHKKKKKKYNKKKPNKNRKSSRKKKNNQNKKKNKKKKKKNKKNNRIKPRTIKRRRVNNKRKKHTFIVSDEDDFLLESTTNSQEMDLSLLMGTPLKNPFENPKYNHNSRYLSSTTSSETEDESDTYESDGDDDKWDERIYLSSSSTEEDDKIQKITHDDQSENSEFEGFMPNKKVILEIEETDDEDNSFSDEDTDDPDQELINEIMKINGLDFSLNKSLKIPQQNTRK